MNIRYIKDFVVKKFTRKSIIAGSALLAVAAAIIIILQWKTVTVDIDGTKMTLSTNAATVSGALESKNITVGPKDIIKPALDSKLEDKELIVIKRAVHVSVSVDGKDYSILSSEQNIDSMLKTEDIVLNSGDKISPDKETLLSEGLEVKIVRVETKTLTETQSIAFSEVVKKDSSLANTKKRILQEGQNGEKQITSSLVLEDGKEVSRTVVGETVTKEPVNRIVAQGTYPLMPVSRGGDVLAFSRVFQARTTAYWAVRGVGKTYTASGRKAVRDPEGYSTVAVDPSIIPYGTKIFVEGYGFAVAADTGTAIVGNTIDVYFDTLAEALRWGAKYVNVYILK